MALTESETTALGSPAPDFDLPATDGERYSLSDFADDQALVVMFICNHCPYVKAVNGRLVKLAQDYASRGVGFVAISSNDAVRYPDDSFERMAEVAQEEGYPFPYCFDETQEIAQAYGAVCTPDFFVYDADRQLAYRGRLDDSWRDASAVTKQELRAALDALLAGEEVSEDQPASMGCSIKWKY